MKKLTVIQLKKLGLKKRWLSDKSGAWWEKTLKGRIPVNILYEEEFNTIILRVKPLSDFKPFKRDACWSFFLIKKATVSNFKKLMHYGKKIASEK